MRHSFHNSDGDYTKGACSRAAAFPKPLWLLLALLPFLVAPYPAAAADLAAASPTSSVTDFSDWHLPLPAGEWQISRGPCGSRARFNHECGYYEERCALDLVPLAGSMQDVPVLAPQSGQVFFLGFRVDAGITLLVRHADGRVSGLMHLAKAVVGPDEPVRQGQVVGYAGSTGSSGNPHLHFFVQPNAVERACVELNALDDINYTRMTATSRNLAWPALALPDPPSALPLWLPTLSAARPVSDVVLPTNVLLEPGTSVRVPVAVTGALAAADSLITAGRQITPALRTTSFAVFEVPLLTAQPPGTYTQSLRLTGRRVTTKTVTLNYEVRAPADTRPSLGLIPLSPNFLGPTSWARLRRSPELCWLAAPNSGQPPFQFRVMIVGPGAVDSGWIGKTCWQTPALEPGTYYWKVFVRDVQGRMNRTNQRPYAFVIRGQ